jgi:8-oxo-dGTP pyrophosphatase MutT (NUDIX family)
LNLPLLTPKPSIPLDFDFTSLYKLLLPGDERPHGFILDRTVPRIPWTTDFVIDDTAKTVHLVAPPSTVDESAFINAAFQRVVDTIVADGKAFPFVSGRHSEKFRVLGANHLVGIERFPAPLFGISSRGAHMTAYVFSADGLRIWVPRRSAHLFTYPGMLDTTVAGGVKVDDSPFECILAEASEEASLPEDLVRSRARAVGAVTYVHENKTKGALYPTVLYVYDLELPEGIVPAPMDDEVEEFLLMTVSEVVEAMLRGEFKPNCVLVMLDFFIRHGIMTAENCTEYVKVLTRLHRRLPVPTEPTRSQGSAGVVASS